MLKLKFKKLYIILGLLLFILVYANSVHASTYKWDIGGLKQLDYDSIESEEIEIELSFYCGVNNAMEGGPNSAAGKPLVYGNLASNYYTGIKSVNGGASWVSLNNGYKLGTNVYIKDVGLFSIEDRGGSSDFNTQNRMDLFIARNSGETDSEYEKRTNSYGRVKVKAKIIKDGQERIWQWPSGNSVISSSNSSTSSNNNSAGLNSKIIYNNTKTITTSGEKPSILTKNCKDAVEEYWSKNTSVSGDNDSIISSGDVSVFNATSQEMADMVIKAISMAQNPKILYRQTGREIKTTDEGLDSMTKTDCSAFVSSLYQTYIGISPGTTSSDMKNIAESGKTINGWTPKIYAYSGDVSVLLPGDILYRDGHVGLYVGEGKQVDHGGPGGKNSESNPNWKGPKHQNITKYTHYIRWSNPNATPVKSESGQTGISNFSARQKPSSKAAIDSILDTMTDEEIMARIIYGEQGGTSFEAQVLVGISILNRGDVKTVAKSKYNNGKYYMYNCIEDAKFWKAIPSQSVSAARKAIEAKKAGTYKVVDYRTNSAVETISVYGFYSDSSSSFSATWNNWDLRIVLKNASLNNYTGFYVP